MKVILLFTILYAFFGFADDQFKDRWLKDSDTGIQGKPVNEKVKLPIQQIRDFEVGSSTHHFFFCKPTISVVGENLCFLFAQSKIDLTIYDLDLKSLNPKKQLHFSNDGENIVFVEEEKFTFLSGNSLVKRELWLEDPSFIPGVISGYPLFIPCTNWLSNNTLQVEFHLKLSQNGLQKCGSDYEYREIVTVDEY